MDEGFLPVFSVDTDDEARMLLTMACPTNTEGEFVSRELAREQTLENLYAFGEKLARVYEMMKAAAKRRRQA